MQQEGKFKHCDRDATQSCRTLLKFTKLEIKATEADQVPEEEAATEEAEDIAQALKRTYAGTVETHGIFRHKAECKANGQECYKYHRLGHLAHMCRSKPRSELKHLEAQQ